MNNFKATDEWYKKAAENNSECEAGLMKFVKEFIESQQPLEPEFEKVLRDNFWELLE